MKNTTSLFTLLLLIIIILSSCNNKQTTEETQSAVVSVKTAPVQYGNIENTINLNGKTLFLKKNTVTSPISGYVQKVYVKFGDKIQKNDILFEIQTKENKALGTTNVGIIQVFAPSSGTINALNINETGAYIMEGAELCNIVENKNLMVQINVPFENNSIAKIGTKCKLTLADNTSFNGVISQVLPTIDETNQTQQVLVKPITNRALPENLNLTVQLIGQKHNNALIIPKNALMTNETQTEFWVMKIASNNIAIKIPVTKGIENNNLVEIISPKISSNDLIISEGAYGLNDSTEVKIK